MKYKFVSILLALCTVAGSMTLPAFADNAQAAQIEGSALTEADDAGTENKTETENNADAVRGYEYKVLDDNTIEITGYQGTDTALVIPDKVDDKPVTAIKEGAFGDCKNLKSIVIPKGVTSLADYVFTGCTGLTDVTFPDGLTAIGESVFSGCASLKNLTFPDSLKNIDFSAFAGCTGLTDLQFPKNLEYVGLNAFSGCKNLKNVQFSEGLRTIAEGAFAGCSSLESIDLPLSTKEIAKNAFMNCDQLKKVAYAGSKSDRIKMQLMGEGNAPLLQSVITYGSTGKSEPFAPKKGAKIRDGVTTYQVKTDVSELAFVKTADQATKITVKDQVTIDGICYTVASVTKNAFLNNKRITKVTIQGEIKSIGKSAFKGCSRLNKIIVRSSRLESVGANALKGISPNAVIKVYDLKLNEYKKLFKNKGQGSRVKIVAY